MNRTIIRDGIIGALVIWALVCASIVDVRAAELSTITVEQCYEGGPNGLIAVSGLPEDGYARVYALPSDEYAEIPGAGGGLSVAPGDYSVITSDRDTEVLVVIDPCQPAEPTAKPHAAATLPPLPPTDTATDSSEDAVLIVVLALVGGVIGFVAMMSRRR